MALGFGVLSQQLLGLISAFGGLTGVMEVTARTLGEVATKFGQINNLVKADQRLSVINQGLAENLMGNMDALKDTTAGLKNATLALTEFRVIGFKKTNKNLVDLATRLKLSGQDTKALFSVSKALLSAGDLTEKQIDSLAKSITGLSKSFGVTADSLIKSVAALSRNLPDLSVVGGTEAATQFATNLTASLGQGFGDLGASLAQQLTSANADASQLALAGMLPFVDSVFRGQVKTAREIEDAFIQSRNQLRSIVGMQGEISFLQFQALRSQIGEVGVNIIRAGDRLLEKSEEASKPFDKIGELLAVLSQKFLVPFNNAIAKLAPATKQMLIALSFLGTSVMNLVAAFTPLIKLFIVSVTGIATLLGGVINALGQVIDKLFSFLSTPFTPLDTVGGFSDVFEEGFKALKMINQDSSEALRTLAGIEAEREGRRLAEVQAASTNDFITSRQLLVIDALGRSVELGGINELVRLSGLQLDGIRTTAENTVPREPSAGAGGAADR